MKHVLNTQQFPLYQIIIKCSRLLTIRVLHARATPSCQRPIAWLPLPARKRRNIVISSAFHAASVGTLCEYKLCRCSMRSCYAKTHYLRTYWVIGNHTTKVQRPHPHQPIISYLPVIIAYNGFLSFASFSFACLVSTVQQVFFDSLSPHHGGRSGSLGMSRFPCVMCLRPLVNFDEKPSLCIGGKFSFA